MWVGYVRVSDVGERGGDSFRSPEDQAAAIRAWAKARGEAVDVLPAELDESGGRADRPIFMQALEGIQSGKYQGIVALNQSRLMRDTAHLLVMVDSVRRAGGEVEVVEGRVDWETPEGRMMGTIIAAIDEQQRRGKSRDFAHHRKSSVERGIWKQRQTPIGYSRDPETRGLVFNKDADRVVRAFDARKSGASVTTVAEILDMTPSGARAVLRNRVYIGELKQGVHVNPNGHKPIIDLATFEAVQALRQTRPARGDLPISLLAGLARCGSCGHIMAIGRHGKYGGTYGCRGRHSQGPCPRPTGITAPLIEEFVSDAARTELERLRISTSRRTEGLAQLRDDVLRAESELAAFLSETRAAGLPLGSFAAGARERQDAIDTAKAALDAHHTLTPIGGTFETGAELWDDLDQHERNQLLRGLLDGVVVKPVGRGKVVPVAERVRLFKHGALEIAPWRGAAAIPIRALPFPDLDDERLLGVPGLEDRLSDSGS